MDASNYQRFKFVDFVTIIARSTKSSLIVRASVGIANPVDYDQRLRDSTSNAMDETTLSQLHRVEFDYRRPSEFEVFRRQTFLRRRIGQFLSCRYLALHWALFLPLVPSLIGRAGEITTSESPSPLSPDLIFQKEIRPLLADRCFRCHGPDSEQRQADLRLDIRDSAIDERSGRAAIVPSRPEQSEILRRLTSDDPEIQMPPPGQGDRWTSQQVDRLRQWIASGAAFDKYWSFRPPVRHRRPTIRQTPWPQQRLDEWILARLQVQKLIPSGHATRATLVRRLSLDLTGLPPDQTAFEFDQAESESDQYERLIDRLLASPRYGERMATFWLDAARYADTNGYFVDGERAMWRWRDNLIQSFNRDQPLDEFTVEQLAGDLLPQATIDQQIASGFHRNHMTTNETGVIDEEYRISYVMDRLETTGTVWLGLTLNCARCHSHKFDPITQHEYYQLLSFFNQVDEHGDVQSSSNSSPQVPTPTFEQVLQEQHLQRLLLDSEKQWKLVEPAVNTALVEWLSTLPHSQQHAQEHSQPLVSAAEQLARFTFDNDDDQTLVEVSGAARPAEIAAGVLGKAIRLDGYSHFAAPEATKLDFERTHSFTLGVWVKPASGNAGCIVSKMDDEQFLRGYDLIIEKSKAVIHLNHRAESVAIRVRSRRNITPQEWQHLVVTYDGSSRASGVELYINGEPEPVIAEIDRLDASIRNDQPFRIGRRRDSLGFSGAIDEVVIYDRSLSAADIASWFAAEDLRSIVALKVEDRSVLQQQRILQRFLSQSGKSWSSDYRQYLDAQSALQALRQQIPTTMVMQERPDRRPTFVLRRGQYDQPGDRVETGFPTIFDDPFATRAKASDSLNRLDLARWIVDRQNPLTARVLVNRIWAQFFGAGIVKSTNDFGVQGEWPSHWELLDELALDFQESGWDQKRLIRHLVTSSTYRQASETTAFSRGLDPENRLLARGPRFRLDAEAIRDQALAVSGLLDRTIGGPSVKPYQPPGLWEAVSYNGEQSYVQDHGSSLYRRSLYTFLKRQSPPPSFLTWDGPTRETCAVQRQLTNTPLQALVLTNDTTYVEAARVWAGNLLLQSRVAADGPDIDERIRRALRQLLGRDADQEELVLLGKLYADQLAEFRNRAGSAARLLKVGEFPATQAAAQLEPESWAAFTMVLQVILNLDEAITKE